MQKSDGTLLGLIVERLFRAQSCKPCQVGYNENLLRACAYSACKGGNARHYFSRVFASSPNDASHKALWPEVLRLILAAFAFIPLN